MSFRRISKARQCPKCKIYKYKSLEGNTGESLCDPGNSDHCSHIMSKVGFRKGMVDKLDFTKMENCSVRDTVNRMRQLATLRGSYLITKWNLAHVVVYICNCNILTEDHEFEANWGHTASLQRKRGKGGSYKGEMEEKEKQKQEKRNRMRKKERTAV